MKIRDRLKKLLRDKTPLAGDDDCYIVADKVLKAIKDTGHYIEFGPAWGLTAAILALDKVGVNKRRGHRKGYLVFIEE